MHLKAKNSMHQGWFCLSLFSCNFDEQLNPTFRWFVILCVLLGFTKWEYSPSEGTGLWQLPKVYPALNPIHLVYAILEINASVCCTAKCTFQGAQCFTCLPYVFTWNSAWTMMSVADRKPHLMLEHRVNSILNMCIYFIELIHAFGSFVSCTVVQLSVLLYLYCKCNIGLFYIFSLR